MKSNTLCNKIHKSTLIGILSLITLPSAIHAIENTLTTTQSNAVLGVITNFILNDGIVHNGTSYGTVTSPYTGKVWLDKNLGATRICTSFNDTQCYGDYYQWGREFDGHQNKNSGILNTLALDITSAGSNFIATSDNSWLVSTFDTFGTIRQANWTSTNGTSICPKGFRVPTSLELSQETIDEGVTDGQTAFENFLKIPSAGERISNTGVLSQDNIIAYWTDTPFINIASAIIIYDGNALITNISMSTGLSVRCIKD